MARVSVPFRKRRHIPRERARQSLPATVDKPTLYCRFRQGSICRAVRKAHHQLALAALRTFADRRWGSADARRGGLF
jgi:hypothetical protein